VNRRERQILYVDLVAIKNLDLRSVNQRAFAFLLSLLVGLQVQLENAKRVIDRARAYVCFEKSYRSIGHRIKVPAVRRRLRDNQLEVVEADVAFSFDSAQWFHVLKRLEKCLWSAVRQDAM